MSLLTDPADYATAFARYADCVVSILLRGGQSVAKDNECVSKDKYREVDIINSVAVDEYSQIVWWLIHTLSCFVQKLLSVLGKAGPDASLDFSRGLPVKKDLSGFCDTELKSAAGA